MTEECKKCNCVKCRDNERVFLKLSPGEFYLDGFMCINNKITIQRDGKDISDKCVGIVSVDPKLFGQKDSFWDYAEDKKNDDNKK